MSKRLQNSRSRDSIALVRKARGLLAVAGACAFDRIFLASSTLSTLPFPLGGVKRTEQAAAGFDLFRTFPKYVQNSVHINVQIMF